MTNRPNGTLYLGVTSNLARRAWEHREGAIEVYEALRSEASRLARTSRGHPNRHSAREDDEALAARLEGEALILDMNPGWRDLYDDLA